jgi:type IV pilus assembly protein PilM
VVDWKKEIKLSDLVGGSKKKQDKQSAPAAKAEAAPKPRDEKQSIWKKEISFGRKPKDVAPAPVPEPEPGPDVVEEPAAAVELVDAYVAPVEAPRAQPERVEASGESAAFELFEVVDTNTDDAPDEPVDLSEATDAPTDEVPAPPPAAAVPVPPAPASAPVVVHPPVPAAALPALPDDKPKRRSFSFARKDEDTKAEKPKREKKEKAPRAERAKREREPRAARASRGGKPSKKLVGLKIGASQIAAATVANNGHAEVVQLARHALEPGIVSAGELREPDALADALREFFKEHKLPKKGVRLGIATNRIGVRTLEISGIHDPKQLANAIKFRAQEALPIPIDEAVLDYQVLGEETNGDGEPVRKILLVLAYRDLIDRYVGACRKAGIVLSGIDLEAFALLRALAAPPEDEAPAEAALVAVTIGHDRTTFAVSNGRVCEFTRVLDWGGHALSVALARALERTPSEVEDVKHALTLDGNEVPEGLTPEQAAAARDALRKQVQSFARELVSSLQFYQNQPGSLGIGEIIITGGTAHLAGLADELQRLIGVRVRVGDPLVRVKLSKKFKEPEQLGSLAVAIGLGIED